MSSFSNLIWPIISHMWCFQIARHCYFVRLKFWLIVRRFRLQKLKRWWFEKKITTTPPTTSFERNRRNKSHAFRTSCWHEQNWEKCNRITLYPACNEFGENEHPVVTSWFVCTKIIDSNIKKVRVQWLDTSNFCSLWAGSSVIYPGISVGSLFFFYLYFSPISQFLLSVFTSRRIWWRTVELRWWPSTPGQQLTAPPLAGASRRSRAWWRQVRPLIALIGLIRSYMLITWLSYC